MQLSNEWKQELSIDDYQPFSLKVSLFDLGFYIKDGQVYTRYNSADLNTNGFELEHSVIVFDEKTYNILEDGIISANDMTTNEYKKSGINVAVPYFDLRDKPLYLYDGNQRQILKSEGLEAVSESAVSAKAKKFAIKPLHENDYYYKLQSGATAKGFKVFDKDAVKNFNTVESFLEATVGNLTISIDDSVADSDLILCSEDLVFESKFLSHKTDYRAFSKIIFNHESNNFWKCFCRYYGAQATNFNYTNFIGNVAGNLCTDISNEIVYLLKHCYVLLKCSFFADVIDYLDFSQSLNKSAKVIHNNLILSAKGDYNRYDKFHDSLKESSKNSNPYIPTTTPSIDRLAKQIVKSLGGSTDNNESILNTLIENSSDPNSIIGSVPTDTFETIDESMDSSFSTKANSAQAPLWFDSESRKSADEYLDVPIVFSKDGNLITDGRILSRTIDELWEMIKKLVAGRNDDREESAEIAYPRGKDAYATKADTRPSIRHHKLNEAGNIGDPTYISYTSSNPLQFKVEEWVNDPTVIDYQLLPELKALLAKEYPDLADVTEAISSIEKYKPAAQPYSLRELEALLRGVQYNLACLTVFSKDNFVRFGHNYKAGSLFQTHKDYDGDKDTSFTGIDSVTAIDETTFGKNQDVVPPQHVFMSAAGTWQTVSQCMRLRVRTDETW